MPPTSRTGLGFVAFALLGLISAALPSHSGSSDPSAKSYAFAISGWSDMRLIELGTDWPISTKGPDDRLMFCLHVMRLAGFEVGARCAPKATTITEVSEL